MKQNVRTLMNPRISSQPLAPRRPYLHSIHGDERPDPYYWLNQREDPEVIAALNAENAYREAVMAPLKPLQDQLYAEIIGRIKQEDQSVPVMDNGYYYRIRMESGKEYPIYCRHRESMANPEEIMLDVNQLARSHPYYHIAGRSVSPDNVWLAFGEDTVSRRIYNIRFRNLMTGEFLAENIPGTTGNAVWANDNKTLFYTVRDPETLRSFKIFRHVLGTPATQDVMVYHEEDDTFHTFVSKTRSRRFLMIGSAQTVSSEYRFLDADDPMGTFKVIHPRERNLEYEVSHLGDHFYIRTNWQARNFQLMRAPVEQSGKEHWEIVIPHREDVLLEGITLFNGYLALEERIRGINHIRVLSHDGAMDHYINFGEESYVASVGLNPDVESEVLRLHYTSMTAPNSTFDYQMGDGQLLLLKEEEVVGTFRKEDYKSERVYVPVGDGAEVPVSIVYKKGFLKDGRKPLLLYGYGSYGHSIDPYFSSPRLSLLDRGFAFAIAHIRGGEEMGRHWYEEGKLLQKKNTFTDFIAVAEYLIQNQYTAPHNLYAMGGSAGGLLVGAVMNMRPDLWKGIIAAVPFVDVVTTMLDTSIPLTTGEYDEWGNPNDPVYYDYIKSYSPYDNVEAKDYPAMLVTTGLHDSQVQYWEPAKWVALLRELKTDDNPLLMYCNMDTGHGGASGRFERHRETAMEYAFLLDLAGIAAGELESHV